MGNSSGKRIIYYDFMRAISMLYIICVFHYSQYLYGNLSKWYSTPIAQTLTICALSMFTYISGVFSAKININKCFDTKQYYKKRIMRLYPLYLLGIAGLCFCGKLTGINHILLALFGNIGCLIPYSPITIWYICMLFVFYLLVPFLHFAYRRKVFFFLVFCLFVWIVFALDVKIIGGDFRVFLYWPFFTLGFYIHKEKRISDLLFQMNHLLLLNIFIMIVSFIVSVLVVKHSYIWSSLCAICMIYFSSVIGKEINEGSIISKIIRILSYASYCAYLFHRPIYYVLGINNKGFLDKKLFIFHFIVLFVICYFVQSFYDYLINRYIIRGISK